MNMKDKSVSNVIEERISGVVEAKELEGVAWKREVMKRLAHMQDQVLWRDDLMPEDAVAWFKPKGGFGKPKWIAHDHHEVVWEVARDVRPNEDGPIFLPIIDPPEEP